MSLDYRIERDAETTTVVPEGDIGIETVDVFREILRGVVDHQTGGRIDVDMSAVGFLDSSGIGVIVAAQRAAAGRDISLMLRDPGPVVRMVLQVAHLEAILVREPAI